MQNSTVESDTAGNGMDMLSGSTPNRNILVVDDNRSIHEDFRKILCADVSLGPLQAAEAALWGENPEPTDLRGFELDSAYQGRDGLALVEQGLARGRRYAMAFVDMRMPPGWDGVETVQQIWRVDPEIQVVICTAYADCSWEQMYEKIGNSDRMVILKKPFDIVEPLQLAHTLTEKWSLLQQSKRRIQDLETQVTQRTGELQKQVQLIQHLVTACPSVIYSFKVSGQLLTPTWVSPNLRVLTGYEAEAALDPGWWEEGVHPDDRPLRNEHLQRAFQEPCGYVEYRFRHLNGAWIWIADQFVMQPDSRELVGSWSEISRRKAMEARLLQQQRMEVVAKLAGGVAHEFNSLLTAILGNVDLMLLDEELQSRHLRESLGEIHLASQRAARLTNKLQAYGRNQFLRPRPVDVAELVQGMSGLLRHLLGRKISLNIENEAGGPCTAVADVEQLEEVILHLASNAREAMPDGGIFTLKTGRINREDTEYIQLTVNDSGVGMAPEVMARAFEPFFSTKHDAPARGLGLAASYGTIHQSGGLIQLASEPGLGTTVTLLLPTDVPG